MKRKELRRVIEAHDAVWEGWWPILTKLPRTAAHQRLPGSFSSVFATTKHLVEAETYWQSRLEAREQTSEPTAARTVAQLERAWRRLQTRRQAWLSTADPQGEVHFEAAGGSQAKVSAWECLIHVISHAHFHRGALATQLRHLRIHPPSLHLIGPLIGEF
jgi:uncharacterized damage-inducible protein DinB